MRLTLTESIFTEAFLESLPQNGLCHHHQLVIPTRWPCRVVELVR